MRQATRAPSPGPQRAWASFLPMRVRMDWRSSSGGVSHLDNRKVHELLPRRLTQSGPIPDVLA
jgi:hypothetical protein